MIDEKKALHAAFWRGEGPCLLLVPAARNSLYDLTDYPVRFRDPERMWESEMQRARAIVDWPTDGIPSVRPNLGVTFIPAIAGQTFQVPPDAMPWPGPPLSLESILAARRTDVASSDMFALARAFYELHRAAPESSSVAAYLADTQGVFDVAHLLRGDEIFFDVADPAQNGTIQHLMDVCFLLYERVTGLLKGCLGEPRTSMIHGHGTEQGLYFPEAGVRVAEDTATLLSPAAIEAVILPAIARCGRAFGGVFVHYCGKHKSLLRQLVEQPEVKAVDLGNPEHHETRRLMEACAATDTVLYSRLAAEPGEDWRTYIERLAGLVRETRARVVLRPLVFPDLRQDCREMLDLWHTLTTEN